MRPGIYLLLLLSLAALLAAGCGGGGGGGGAIVISANGIETLPDEGRSPVPPDVQVIYKTDPPTSGPHYSTPTAPGVYTTGQQAGNLVKALFRSNVVIYFDPARVTSANQDSLKALAGQHTDPYAGIIVVPRTDSTYAIILTAWQRRLRLNAYDEARIQDFLTQFLGKGPATQAQPEIEAFRSEGSTKYAAGTPLTYEDDPPTSGAAYVTATSNGFYDTAQATGSLVHALEHGNIVIYYDKNRISASDLNALKAFAAQYTDPYAGVIVAPRADANYLVILTAWQYRLRLTAYDATLVQSFLTQFRGKGPVKTDHGDTVNAVENLPEEGRTVIPPTTTPTYQSDPPTSGSFYSTPTAPGFYTAAQKAGNLVKALFRSNVVVYYDPARTSSTVQDDLKLLAQENPGLYDGVVVTPRTDANYPIILTAWQHRLRLASFDHEAIHNFVDQFRGKGPVTQAQPEIEAFRDEGHTHVPVGTQINYENDPPTSGPHYPSPATNGFYTTVPALGFLVHALEHSNIIIWYDQNHLSASDIDALKALVNKYPEAFAGVICVPRSDADYPLILTAWQYRLRLPGYDPARIQTFIDLYRGKGPERQQHSD